MTLVTEGLRFGLAAGAPKIFLAWRELDFEWLALGHCWMRVGAQVPSIVHPWSKLDPNLLKRGQVLWLRDA